MRKKVGPDFPVTIRLSGTDYEPDGFPIEDTIELAKALEKEGIDAFHISGGDHHTMIHQVSPMAIPVCHNTWAAEAIKKARVVCRSSPPAPSPSPNTPRKFIASGKGDFVGLGRPLWADPAMAQQGLQRTIPRTSVPASAATRAAWSALSLTTRPSPALSTRQISREGRAEDQARRRAASTVAVVGRRRLPAWRPRRVTKLRGHDVTVFEEKPDRTADSLHEAAAPEFKADIRPLMKYQATAARESWGSPSIREQRRRRRPWQGYDAVGLRHRQHAPSSPSIPGVEKPIAVDCLSAINGAKPCGRAASIVIGGGLVGTETALDLAENGHQGDAWWRCSRRS